MSSGEWQRVLNDCLEHPDRSHLVRAAVSFDFRHVVGGLDIVRPLVAIERQAPQPSRLRLAGWPAPPPTSRRRWAAAASSRPVTTAAST